jgi:hypothetical protein
MKLNMKLTNYIKLFSTGIILLWLFIQSPINPLFSDYDKNDLFFVKIQFVYWMLLSVFLLWLIYFVNRSNYEKHLLLIYLASNFLYLTFFIFFGFDVLDTGFSLSKQWSMYHGLWNENFDAITGTNMIGGLWLLIPGRPLLIWARLGFVITQVAMIFMSFKILGLYFERKLLFTAMLPISFFLAVWYYYQTINYDNLPYLFFITSIYLILKALKKDDFVKSYYVLSGVFALLAVFCKVTYLISLSLPLVLILLDFRILKTKDKYLKKKIIYFSLGIFSFFIILTAIALLTGGFESYINNLSELFANLNSNVTKNDFKYEDHSFSRLSQLYKSNLLTVVLKTSKYLLTIFIIEFILLKLQYLKVIKALMTLLAFFILYYLTFEITSTNQFTSENYTNVLSFFLSIYLLWVLSTQKLFIKKYLILLISAFGMFFFSFIGSDMMFRAAFQAGSGLILFSLPVILIKNSELNIIKNKIRFDFLFYFVVIAFSLNSIYKKDNLYIETSIKYFSKSFETDCLTGIKSNPNRVDVVDSLLNYLNSISKLDSKKIIFTHSNPLMYYLTSTNYPLVNPWDFLNNYRFLEDNLRKIQPDIFVIPLGSHRVCTWPVKAELSGLEERHVKHYALYEEFIREYKYKLTYKNSFYTVYSKE